MAVGDHDRVRAIGVGHVDVAIDPIGQSDERGGVGWTTADEAGDGGTSADHQQRRDRERPEWPAPAASPGGCGDLSRRR